MATELDEYFLKIQVSLYDRILYETVFPRSLTRTIVYQVLREFPLQIQFKIFDLNDQLRWDSKLFETLDVSFD